MGVGIGVASGAGLVFTIAHSLLAFCCMKKGTKVGCCKALIIDLLTEKVSRDL